MQKLTVNSPCKINLSLDILGLREDNYHYVDMILQTVSLSDTVCITRNESQKITVSTNLIYLPNNEKNIAFKSAVLFFDACQIPKKDRGVHIRIDKKVPICAGLGGGSSNSAAVFCGLNKIYNTNLSKEELSKISEQAGADVSFLISCGAARVSGIGEIIKPITPLKDCHILIVKPIFGAKTKVVYQKYDNMPALKRVDTDSIEKALKTNDLKLLCENMANVLQPVTQIMCKSIADIVSKLESSGAEKAMMTGSGTAVFGIFKTKASLKAAEAVIRRNYKQVFECTPIDNGIYDRVNLL